MMKLALALLMLAMLQALGTSASGRWKQVDPYTPPRSTSVNAGPAVTTVRSLSNDALHCIRIEYLSGEWRLCGDCGYNSGLEFLGIEVHETDEVSGTWSNRVWAGLTIAYWDVYVPPGGLLLLSHLDPNRGDNRGAIMVQLKGSTLPCSEAKKGVKNVTLTQTGLLTATREWSSSRKPSASLTTSIQRREATATATATHAVPATATHARSFTTRLTATRSETPAVTRHRTHSVSRSATITTPAEPDAATGSLRRTGKRPFQTAVEPIVGSSDGATAVAATVVGTSVAASIVQPLTASRALRTGTVVALVGVCATDVVSSDDDAEGDGDRNVMDFMDRLAVGSTTAASVAATIGVFLATAAAHACMIWWAAGQSPPHLGVVQHTTGIAFPVIAGLWAPGLVGAVGFAVSGYATEAPDFAVFVTAFAVGLGSLFAVAFTASSRVFGTHLEGRVVPKRLSHGSDEAVSSVSHSCTIVQTSASSVDGAAIPTVHDSPPLLQTRWLAFTFGSIDGARDLRLTSHRMYFVVDVGCACALAVTATLRPRSRAECIGLASVNVLVMLACTLYHLLIRPLRSRIEQAFATVASSLQAAAAVMQLMIILGYGNGDSLRFSLALVTLATAATFFVLPLVLVAHGLTRRSQRGNSEDEQTTPVTGKAESARQHDTGAPLLVVVPSHRHSERNDLHRASPETWRNPLAKAC